MLSMENDKHFFKAATIETLIPQNGTSDLQDLLAEAGPGHHGTSADILNVSRREVLFVGKTPFCFNDKDLTHLDQTNE